MPKLQSLTVAVSITALTAFIPRTAYAGPLPKTSSHTASPHSQFNTPVCYIQTQNGMTIDLESLCGKSELQENKLTYFSTEATTVTPTRTTSHPDDYPVGETVNPDGTTARSTNEQTLVSLDRSIPMPDVSLMSPDGTTDNFN